VSHSCPKDLEFCSLKAQEQGCFLVSFVNSLTLWVGLSCLCSMVHSPLRLLIWTSATWICTMQKVGLVQLLCCCPIFYVTVPAGTELLLTNEWGWEDACSVQDSCTIVRFDQYRSMYKLDRLRPPCKTFYYRYLLDNDSRIGRKPVVLMYNKLRPAFIRLPGPTDMGLCTSKTFEHYASRVWQKIRTSLQHRGMKGMVTVDTTPEFLASVARQLQGAAKVTPCVIIHEGRIVFLCVVSYILFVMLVHSYCRFHRQPATPIPSVGWRQAVEHAAFLTAR
jgi:hypothetical protein